MNRYVVRITGTDLWLHRNIVFGHSGFDNYTHDWVLSPLNATRWETIKGAAKDAEQGVPVGHFEILRLLEATEPVGTERLYYEEEEARVKAVKVVNCGHLCGDKKHWWCRLFSC